jgi:hypothetical protein
MLLTVLERRPGGRGAWEGGIGGTGSYGSPFRAAPGGVDAAGRQAPWPQFISSPPSMVKLCPVT